MHHAHTEDGFTLPELIVTMAIMLIVAGAATSALLKMGTTQATIWNRTQMHSGIRGATEVLQQEVGQAGRVSLPASATLEASVSPGTRTVAVSSASGMFVGEKLTIDSGCYDTATPCTSRQEVVTLTAVDASGNTITAEFGKDHALGASVQALGGFHAGIVPAATTDGSTASVLKLFGDVNGDGSMVYVEYSIAPACICASTCPAIGSLYRNSMAWDAASKPAPSASQVLLGNIVANPNGTPCFTYQTTTPVNGRRYVTDVAITLTVQTQLVDPVTKAYQRETKALLNVTPRNVYNTWQLASLGYGDRVQDTPAPVTALLAGTGF
jgi:prepilin-type N-terminal cleavage/methylation domain-containing protein